MAKSILWILGSVVVVGGLFWWAAGLVQSTGGLSVGAWVALGFGVFFTVVIGAVLMFLLFYSSRKGYDDRGHDYDAGPPPRE